MVYTKTIIHLSASEISGYVVMYVAASRLGKYPQLTIEVQFMVLHRVSVGVKFHHPMKYPLKC